MEFRWFAFKSSIVVALGFSPLAIHFWLGGLIFLGIVALLCYHPRRWIFAWYSVLIVAIINEILDTFDWIERGGRFDVQDAVLDVVVTMALPSMVLIVVMWLVRLRQASEYNAEKRHSTQEDQSNWKSAGRF